MRTYTLWAFAEPDAVEALLCPEYADGAFGEAVLVRDAEGVASFVRAHGMPQGITAVDWNAVKRLREGEPRLFHVPATVLKTKELVGPLLAALMRAYQR